MKKYLSIVVALMVTLFTFSSFAFAAPAKPDNGWYVLDQAGKLTSEQVTQLNQKIENLNKTTKNEYAVVILSSLDGSTIEDAAQATFTAWGVGKKGVDNGVMLMISVGDRKTRIHTGLGAEGDLPDIYCKEILNNTLKPLLKRGQWYEGVNATIDAMAGHMESQVKDSAPTTAAPSVSTSHSCSGCSVVGTVVSGLGVLLFFAALAAFFVVRFFVRKARQARDFVAHAFDDDEVTLPRIVPPVQVRRTVPVVTPVVPVVHPTPVAVPVVRQTAPFHPAPVTQAPRPTSSTSGLGTATAVGLGLGASALALAEAERQRAHREREEREEEERRAARKRREREDEEARKRREDDDRSSSYSSSSSSWDSGSSWGGGGFGGGDSGGGGASSDF